MLKATRVFFMLKYKMENYATRYVGKKIHILQSNDDLQLKVMGIVILKKSNAMER